MRGLQGRSLKAPSSSSKRGGRVWGPCPSCTPHPHSAQVAPRPAAPFLPSPGSPPICHRGTERPPRPPAGCLRAHPGGLGAGPQPRAPPLQGGEGVGRWHPRAVAERRPLRPAPRGARPATHQELEVSRPAPAARQAPRPVLRSGLTEGSGAHSSGLWDREPGPPRRPLSSGLLSGWGVGCRGEPR